MKIYMEEIKRKILPILQRYGVKTEMGKRFLKNRLKGGLTG